MSSDQPAEQANASPVEAPSALEAIIPELGPPLSVGDELLFRNARTQFVVDGHVSSQVFEPSSDDHGLLSMDRSTKATPRESFELFLKRPNTISSGVLGVTADECIAQQVPALENPLSDNPAHVVADFRAHNRSQGKRRAGKLRDIALVRGWFHR